MDPSLVSAPAAATFQQQFQEVMYYAGPIIQLAYWLGMLLFVGYAVAIYKTYTNHMMGVGKAGEKKQQADQGSGAVKVEEFVE
jgi:hypothetical protein